MAKRAPAGDAGTGGIGDLEIDQDLAFQRRTWVVERIGWAVMTLAVAAGLLGVFGTGPLSRATAGDPGGPLWLEYERFGRLLSPMILHLHLGPEATRDDTVRVWLDRRYLRDVQLERVTPEPDGMDLTRDRMIFSFRVAERDQPLSVTLGLKPERFGRLTARAGLADAGDPAARPPVEFSQVIYP